MLFVISYMYVVLVYVLYDMFVLNAVTLPVF